MKGHSGKDAESKGGNKTIAFVLLLDRCLFKRIHQEMGDRVTACTRGNVGARAPERDAAGDKAGRPRRRRRGTAGLGGIPREGGRPEKSRRRARPRGGRGGMRPPQALPQQSTRSGEGKAAGQLSKAVEFLFLTPPSCRFEIRCPFKEIAAATNRNR